MAAAAELVATEQRLVNALWESAKIEWEGESVYTANVTIPALSGKVLSGLVINPSQSPAIVTLMIPFLDTRDHAGPLIPFGHIFDNFSKRNLRTLGISENQVTDFETSLARTLKLDDKSAFEVSRIGGDMESLNLHREIRIGCWEIFGKVPHLPLIRGQRFTDLVKDELDWEITPTPVQLGN